LDRARERAPVAACYHCGMKALSVKPVVLALLAASVFLGARSVEPPPAVPFIADDYPGALAQARAKKLPIFVEAWAPW
jgi:hypothetical protein